MIFFTYLILVFFSQMFITVLLCDFSPEYFNYSIRGPFRDSTRDSTREFRYSFRDHFHDSNIKFLRIPLGSVRKPRKHIIGHFRSPPFPSVDLRPNKNLKIWFRRFQIRNTGSVGVFVGFSGNFRVFLADSRGVTGEFSGA